MIKMIVWDMDGTIADLYGVEGWEPMLREENPFPYCSASPMWDMEKLRRALLKLQSAGIDNRIVSWLSKGASEEYKALTRMAKLQWLENYNFPFSKFYGVQYGATKADSVRKSLHGDEEAILIDDNAKVRRGWHLGPAVDPTAIDLVDFLEGLAEDI